MFSAKAILGSMAIIAGMGTPVFADGPGPYIQPYTAPAPPPVAQSYHSTQSTRDLNMQSIQSVNYQSPVAPKYTYSRPTQNPCYKPNPCSAPPPVVHRPAPSPCYKPNPCATTYTNPVPRPTTTTYTKPSNPCYKPNPCGAPTTTYLPPAPKPQPPVVHRPSPCYTPNPCGTTYRPTTTTTYTAPRPTTTTTYHRPPANPCYQPNPCGTTYTRPARPRYVPPPAPPVHHGYLGFYDCGNDVIKRLKDGRNDEKRYSVCYSDLKHLPVYKRNEILVDRIELAARRACDDRSFALYNLRAERKCRTEAETDAVYSANLPGLVEYYFAKNGKRIPRVNVGDPIYN